MELWIVLFILFAHWVADFINQTDEMAQNKSTNIYWLSYHVAAYTTMMLFFTLVLVLTNGILFDVTPPETFVLVSLWCFIFVTHWVTDFITSKITAKFWKSGNMHNFFIVIGFDQWLHAIQLLIIYKVFLL